MTIAPPGLSGDLAGLVGWVACLADARPLDEDSSILAAAGMRTVHTERHDAALARMVEHIDARLRALRMMSSTMPALAGVDFQRAARLTAQAAASVRDGVAGYAMLAAERVAKAGSAPNAPEHAASSRAVGTVLDDPDA